MSKSWRHNLFTVANASLLLLALCGCTPSEEQSLVSVLQTGLNSLTQNRELAEQFSRDIKQTCDPGNAAYQQAEASYDVARDAYNQYLDEIEEARNGSRSYIHPAVTHEKVRRLTARYLADATAALRPNVNTRGLELESAVVVPDDLRQALVKLPKRDRREIIQRFDEQVRWQPWSQIAQD